MCDFKPGDEIEHVGGPSDEWQQRINGSPPLILPTGDRGVVQSIAFDDGYWRMQVTCRPFHPAGYDAAKWRKVQKRKDTRNLTEWLSQPSGYDEEQHSPAPKAPAKKRERAS